MAVSSTGARLSKARLLATIALPLVLTDCATKQAAVRHLQPAHAPHRVVGNTVRLTLGFNRQAVFGLPAGPHGRWLLIGAAAAGLVVMTRLLAGTPASERARAIGLSLLIGGAAGNLLDRLTSGRGVIDFIDLGLGSWRFWTFNVADMGISSGAALLAFALWREARRDASATPGRFDVSPQRGPGPADGRGPSGERGRRRCSRPRAGRLTTRDT